MNHERTIIMGSFPSQLGTRLSALKIVEFLVQAKVWPRSVGLASSGAETIYVALIGSREHDPVIKPKPTGQRDGLKMPLERVSGVPRRSLRLPFGRAGEHAEHKGED